MNIIYFYIYIYIDKIHDNSLKKDKNNTKKKKDGKKKDKHLEKVDGEKRNIEKKKDKNNSETNKISSKKSKNKQHKEPLSLLDDDFLNGYNNDNINSSMYNNNSVSSMNDRSNYIEFSDDFLLSPLNNNFNNNNNIFQQQLLSSSSSSSVPSQQSSPLPSQQQSSSSSVSIFSTLKPSKIDEITFMKAIEKSSSRWKHSSVKVFFTSSMKPKKVMKQLSTFLQATIIRTSSSSSDLISILMYSKSKLNDDGHIYYLIKVINEELLIQIDIKCLYQSKNDSERVLQCIIDEISNHLIL